MVQIGTAPDKTVEQFVIFIRPRDAPTTLRGHDTKRRRYDKSLVPVESVLTVDLCVKTGNHLFE